MQKVEGDYVYFYPHYNFFSAPGRYFHQPPNERRIAALKESNSWNQEMSDTSAFVRARIVTQIEPGPISDEKLANVFFDVFYDAGVPRRHAAIGMIFLRTDDYGRSVYLGIGAGQYWISTHKAVFFQPDHSFDIETGVLLITDNYNYQTDLRLFMEANGWNTPFNP